MSSQRKRGRRAGWMGTALAAVLVTAGQVGAPTAWAQSESVTVLAGYDALFTPAYVAEKEKLFEQEGLAVSMKYSVSGKVAVDALVAGAGVMGVSGSLVSVSAAAAAPVYIVAPIARSEEVMFLITAPGIGTAADLKGKRLGFQFGTEGHRYTLLYLQKNGVAEGQVTLQNVPVEALPAAFARGDLQAVALWEPHATKALQALPGAKILATSRGVSAVYGVVTMRKDFVELKPELARKLLRAMLRATEFINANPDRAAQYLADAGKIEAPLARQMMKGMTYGMALDKAFYDEAEDVAGFLHLRGLTKAKADPREFVYDRLMRDVAPVLVK